MNEIQLYLEGIIEHMGVNVNDVGIVSRMVLVCIIVLLVLLAYHFCHKILYKVVSRITQRTVSRWDDHLLGGKVLDSLCHLLPPLLLYILLPVAFVDIA